MNEVIEKLTEFLREMRESDGGWAPVSRKDLNDLHELIEIIVNEKFESDADGNLPVEWILINRNKQQRLHYWPLPYPESRKRDMTKEEAIEDALDRLRAANTNLGIAYHDHENITKEIQYLRCQD